MPENQPEIMLRMERPEVDQLREGRIHFLDKYLSSAQTLQLYLAGIFHELIQPLTILKANLDYAKGTSHGPAESLDSVLAPISMSVDRLQAIVRELQEFSAATLCRAKPTTFNISDLATTLSADLVRVNGYSPSTRFDIQPGLEAYGYTGAVNLALRNIIGNALKYTQKRPDPLIAFGKEDGRYFVRDNGIGFTQNDAIRLFEPGYRVADVKYYNGNGIGLSIAKAVILIHGGVIEANSAGVGKGSTIYFTLGVGNS